MKTKSDLDRNVAVLLGMQKKDVAVLTTAFLNELMLAIASDKDVHLLGFGRFHLAHKQYNILFQRTGGTGRKGGRVKSEAVRIKSKNHVYFRQMGTFRAIIRRNNAPAKE